ncbi:hypothetical protein KY284_032725 [Solanum tuberosum]|nr:hypothetical protein KY284_032725 [Solanum tuberosum]
MMVAHLCQGDQALCTHSLVNLSFKFLDHVTSENNIVSTNRSFPCTGTNESIKRMTLSRHRAIHLITVDNRRAIHLITVDNRRAIHLITVDNRQAIHLVTVDNYRSIHLVTIGQSSSHPPRYSWTIIEPSTSLQLDNHRAIHLITIEQSSGHSPRYN